MNDRLEQLEREIERYEREKADLIADFDDRLTPLYRKREALRIDAICAAHSWERLQVGDKLVIARVFWNERGKDINTETQAELWAIGTGATIESIRLNHDEIYVAINRDSAIWTCSYPAGLDMRRAYLESQKVAESDIQSLRERYPQLSDAELYEVHTGRAVPTDEALQRIVDAFDQIERYEIVPGHFSILEDSQQSAIPAYYHFTFKDSLGYDQFFSREMDVPRIVRSDFAEMQIVELTRKLMEWPGGQ